MIKTGIYGADSPCAASLIKLLLHHPDVDLRWLCSGASNAGIPVADFHPQLTGETDMVFVATPALGSVDVIFLAASAKENRALLATSPELAQDVRLIDMSGEFLQENPEGNRFVYGLPELNRKVLVRGATRAVLPTVAAAAVALPLLPLAKNLLLNSPVHSAVVGSGMLMPDKGKMSAGNLVSMIKTSDKIEEEVAHTLRELQTSFNAPISIIPVAADEGLMSVIQLNTAVSAEEITRIYKTFFSDHSFVTVTDTEPTLQSVRGTNKAVICLRKNSVSNKLTITTVMDDSIKGFSGNAVHIMNLLFGLSEKTGLIL